MNYLYPDYYKEFTCIASDCKDNCCIGWEIDIDSKTEEDYRQISGQLGEKLAKSIVQEEGISHFALIDQRCPFLDNNHLCEIILNIGENRLCKICREHPRFHHQYGNWKESGLGICCEEAARLLFASSEPIEFLVESDDQSSCGDEEDIWIDVLQKARQTAFEIMQKREFAIRERLALLLAFGEDLQDLLDFSASEQEFYQTIQEYSSACYLENLLSQLKESPEEISDHLDWWRNLLSFYRSLEKMNERWLDNLDDRSTSLYNVLNRQKDFENCYLNGNNDYEHFCVYLLFRYWMDSLYDSDLLSRVKFTVVSFLFLNLLDCSYLEKWRKYDQCDRIEIAKSYSKEIEYSPQNLRRILEKLNIEEMFSTTELFSVLLDG